MAVDFDDLVRNGVDIAATVNEVFLNKFSASHHRAVPSIYEGKQRFSHFDNDVEIRYKVAKPIQFDFSGSIPAARFRKLWVSHLKTKGADPRLSIRNVITTPPNIRLSCDDLIFEVVVYDGHSSTIVLSVDFSWSLEALAALTLMGNVVKLDPLRVSFSTGTPFVQAEIAAKIADRSKSSAVKQAHPTTFGDPTDPVWCAKLEQMILLLINQVLATQIANFIRAWELPRAIEVADGIAIAPIYLAIHGDDLVVGAQVVTQPIGPSALQQQLDAFMHDFRLRAEKEYSSLSDAELRLWHPDRSPTVQWMSQYVQSVEATMLEELQKFRDVKPATFAPNLQLLFNDKLFDVLAKRLLSVNQGWQGSKELDRIVKGTIGWWFRVENASSKVVTGGIQVNADVSIGASASICHFDVDLLLRDEF